MAFVSRYLDDQSRPTVKAALADMGRRAVLPAFGLWCLIVAGGFLIKGPLGDLPGEDQIYRDARAAVGAGWDGLTHWWSTIGNTEIIDQISIDERYKKSDNEKSSKQKRN